MPGPVQAAGCRSLSRSFNPTNGGGHRAADFTRRSGDIKGVSQETVCAGFRSHCRESVQMERLTAQRTMPGICILPSLKPLFCEHLS